MNGFQLGEGQFVVRVERRREFIVYSPGVLVAHGRPLAQFDTETAIEFGAWLLGEAMAAVHEELQDAAEQLKASPLD